MLQNKIENLLEQLLKTLLLTIKCYLLTLLRILFFFNISNNVGGEAEGPAAIILESISNQAINIKETGDQVSTAFTFSVQDSADRTISEPTDVNFSILSRPGGAEEIIPKIATTNSQGRVTSSLFSGNELDQSRYKPVSIVRN